MPTSKRSGEVEARIKCQFPGCDRTFSRQEHLQRHELNHSDGDYTCTRCRAHFKRPDLLERHMTRHRQKDAEGSELMTRKRAWKDAEGRIVKRRPATDCTNNICFDEGSQATTTIPSFPPSPPGSASSHLATSPGQALGLSQSNSGILQQYPIDAPSTSQSASLQSIDCQGLFWESNPLLSDPVYSNGPFDDIFMPDTASSFNMPYTTMTNYNWLFNLSIDPDLHSDLSQGSNPTQSRIPSAVMQQPQGQEDIERVENGFNRFIHNPEVTRNQSTACEGSVSCPHYQATHHLPQETPMCLLDPDRGLPTIDILTRERILDVIESCRPTFPDGTLMNIDHPLLSLPPLQSYLDLFFTRFNTVYPLIHLPTFESARTEPILLLSAILLGATYADKEAHQLAVCIHDVLRPYIFSCPGFSARAELWVLQAILLTECLGKSRGGQRQHDMSHLFHGLLINLIRRSDCQTANPEVVAKDIVEDDIENQWRKWAELESKKRLAQLCFVWDVQHAVLFSQSLCMSAFELRTSLPCNQSVWEATTPLEWRLASSSQKQPLPSLLSVLKLYLAPENKSSQRTLNAISRVIILHGLMSVSWDMERRDQTSLGLLSNGIVSGSWRERMAQSYELWKRDFDCYVVDMELQISSDGSLQKEYILQGRCFAIYKTTCNAMFHAASLVLLTDIIDLQIYGGARHILGRPVSKTDYTRSQKVVRRWANEDTHRALKATWHAARLLKEASESKACPFIAADVYHHPWTVFLASLTLWAFYQARPATSTDQEDEMIWDASEHMGQLLDVLIQSPSHSQTKPSNLGKNCTAGLTAVVVGHLSKVRWAVCHDGMMVLKGLVPWRLIYEDDGRK